ncbi:hypothetical protein RUND412_004988 [Rhizina undulata]
MDTVPTEILHEILSHVPESDLGSVRLVNHFFNNVSNDRYFRIIRVSFTKATIQNLLHISHQLHLARCVQKLIFSYRPDIRWFPSSDAYERYGEQRSATQDVFDILKFCLSKMPNIREITAMVDKKEGDDWRESAIVVRDNARGYRRELLKSFHFVAAPSWTEDLVELLAGASKAQTKLEKLTINSMWRGIFTDKAHHLSDITPLFQNLTSLTVFFVIVGGNDDFPAMWEDAMEGRIFKFLSSAPKLKTLSLGLDWAKKQTCSPHDNTVPQ